MKHYKRRDLNILELDAEKSLIIACDSCGGIGLKHADVYKISPYYVGAYTARVVFMEVLCSGAKIVSFVNNICSEMNDTGIEIIRGIKSEMTKINADMEMLTGSTEENFVTAMTAVGITAIGIAQTNQLRFSEGREGDFLILIGTPQCGEEVNLEDDSEIASYAQIYSLLKNRNVREITPVGSKGIDYECGLIAQLNNRKFIAIENTVNVKKSAGPSTCLVALVCESGVATVENKIILGKLGDLCS